AVGDLPRDRWPLGSNSVERGGFVYILTNRTHGVLYVGVTAGIDQRAWLHRNGMGSKFCRKYGLDRLVLVEEYPTVVAAIRREKQVKNWQRAWKIERVEAVNPDWRDLGPSFGGA